MGAVARWVFLAWGLAVAAATAAGAVPALVVTPCGADTRGGLDGRVVKVTTLEAAGPGSLRAALAAAGPRLVVFEVGGVIDLERTSLRVTEPNLTLAGQTAPDPGITLSRGTLEIATHDVLVQHLAVRPGAAGQPHKSGWSPDAICMNAASRVVIDHCSATWAVDENLSASGPRYDGPEATSHDVTIRHCLIAEGLDNASHEKGRHSKGSLIHDSCRNIAVIGNLYAHNADRNPYFKADSSGAIVNNLIYNPGKVAIRVSFPHGEWRGRALPPEGRVTIVGNVLRGGADTRWRLPLIAGTGEVFAQDNLASDHDGEPLPLVGYGIQELAVRPLWPTGLTAIPAAAVAEQVLREAGARPWSRDPIDQRIVDSVRQRQGRVIDSQDEVGSYPHAAPTRRALEVPVTGVEAWLAGFEPEPSRAAAARGRPP
jgi:hypothetical protein